MLVVISRSLNKGGAFDIYSSIKRIEFAAVEQMRERQSFRSRCLPRSIGRKTRPSTVLAPPPEEHPFTSNVPTETARMQAGPQNKPAVVLIFPCPVGRVSFVRNPCFQLLFLPSTVDTSVPQASCTVRPEPLWRVRRYRCCTRE